MLKLENLIKDFEHTRAVDTLNLHVRPGEIFGLLGPSASGKTTTLRLIAGVMRPTYGRVLIAGIDLAQKPRHAKWRIGYVPDQPFFYDRLTGREFIEFHSQLYQLDRKDAALKIDELASQFGIREALSERIETYSRSQRQKIALFCALIRQPGLILLDEPFGNFDTVSVRILKGMLTEIAGAGAAVVIATHSPAGLQDLCHRVGILFRGRLIAEGLPGEIGGAPADDLETAYAKRLARAEAEWPKA